MHEVRDYLNSTCKVRVSKNICVAAVEALRKKERHDWNSVYHQNWWFFWVSSVLRKKERHDETQFITKIDGFFEFHRRSGKSKDMMKLSLSPKLMVFWVSLALRKKERHDETQFITKIDGFFEFHPLLNANVLLSRFLLNLTLCMTKLRVLVLCFSYFRDDSNIPWVFFVG